MRIQNIAGSILLFLSYLLSPCSVNAGVTEGNNWLSAQQQVDGSFVTQTDLANTTQTTYASLSLSALAKSSFTLNQSSAVAYLQSQTQTDTEFLAQSLLSGVTTTSPGQLIATLLTQRQNFDGGFGDQVGYQSTPFDTAWALEALDAEGQLSNNQTSTTLYYLVTTQNADGSWVYPEANVSSIYVTAITLNTLKHFTQYSGVSTAITKAQQYLLSQVGSNNLVNDDLFVSAAVLDALADSNNTSVTQAISNALLANQQADGSWLDDTWTTALVLRALLKQQANNPAASVASVSGRVVVSGSTQPLSGVTVSVIGQSASVVTGSDGRFLLSGVKAGSVNLSFTKNGYNPVSSGGQLNAGQQKDLGDVAMSQGNSSVLLTGSVIDDSTGLAISGATITVAGGASQNISSASDGSFALTLSSAGTYQISVSQSGYSSWSGTYSLSVGTTNLHVGLLPIGTVLNDQPGSLTGRVIDGSTGNGIAGATVSAAGATATTDANGQFSFANVARGNISGSVIANGYQGLTFTYPYPAGSSGALGNLPLYANSPVTVPSTSTLHLTVIDAVTQKPVASAQVQVNGSSASTDNTGIAVISNITSTSITATVSASGYLTTQAQLTSTGFGDLYATAPLTPQTPPATTSILSGVVTDLNNTPIANATISISGTSIQSTSDANGNFTLSGITTLGFTVHAEASGFVSSDRTIQVQAFGNYTTQILLQPSTGQSFTVVSVTAPRATLSAGQDVIVQAKISNLTAQAQDVVIRGLVIDVHGVQIATLPVYAVGTTTPVGAIHFAGNDTLQLQLPWNTQQWPSGTYSVRVDVVQSGTITRDLPTGVMLASGSDGLVIGSSTALSGGFNFVPGMSQAGQQTPVSMGALIRNTGNIPLAAGDYQLIISSPSGSVLNTVTASAPEIAINQIYQFDFGSWIPSQAGNLTLVLQKTDAPTIQITDHYYVGDVATGTFTVDQTQFAEGTHTTQAHIKVQGVDVTQAVSTNPLFVQVKKALTDAGNFVGPAALDWQNRNACMGCHIQSQSLYGLSSAQNKVTVNVPHMNALYNSITGDISDSGYLHTHGPWITTPTSFALWAIDSWPDKITTYKNRVKMLAQLWSHIGNDGTGDFIYLDHNSVWLDPSHEETAYSAIAPALKHLIADKNTIDPVAKTEYSISPALAQIPSGNVYGMYKDGTKVYIARNGGVDVFDTTTNTLTTIFTKYAIFNSVYVDQGTIYLTTSSTVEKVTSPTTSDVLINSGYYSLWQNVVKWNGSLYITDFTTSSIFRLDNSGGTYSLATFVSGGNLGQPVGMTISPDNNLVVANYRYHNILSYSADGSYQVLFDGLIQNPTQITYVPEENNYYFTTDHGGGQVYSGSAVYRGKPDGTIMRLAEHPDTGTISYYGIAYVNGVLYVGDIKDNSLNKVNTSVLDDSIVDVVAGNIPQMVSYILARAPDSNIEVTAQRMYTLSVLRPLVTDATLLSQMDTAIHTADTYLRSLQQSDGGWGLYLYWGSDASTTAWVGLALDTLNPSANDPVVIKTIQYLLNHQMPNGAWPAGGVFSTLEGPTSLVMSYLPTALARLGGLDTDLDLVARPDVILSNFSATPLTSTAQADGGMLYHWHLTGVTGSGQQIDFTTTLNNLQPGEQRPVAESATLNFSNSFTGEKISRPIDVPVVNAINGLALNTATDSSLYGANTLVNVSNQVINTGIAINSGTLKSVIRTTAGAVIYTFPDQTGVALAQNASIALPANWNTGTNLAGAYQVYSQFYDDNNRLRAEATASFAISSSDGSGAPGISYATHVSTDKVLYRTTDTVNIHSRVQNLAVNASQAAVLAKLNVVDAAGNTILSKQWVVPTMPANGLLDYANTLNLHDAVTGNYTVTLELWDANVTTLLSSSQYHFAVQLDVLANITGSVTVSQSTVVSGQPLSCLDKVTNRASNIDVTATIEKLLVNADTQVVVTDSSNTQTLSANTSATTSRNIDTSSLAQGNYSCVLQAVVNGKTNTLGFANFTVTKPPVNIDVSDQLGTHGRLLILLDAAAQTDGRETYLRNILDSEQRSYDIVYTASDFAAHLATGQYAVYGLFANAQPLSSATETALATEVNKGKGLIVATNVDRCDAIMQSLLGVHLGDDPADNQSTQGTDNGHQGDHTTQVLFPLNTLGTGWPAITIKQNVFEDADPASALVIATVLKQCAVNNSGDHQHHDMSVLSSALTDSSSENSSHDGSHTGNHDGNQHDGNNDGQGGNNGQSNGDDRDINAAVAANSYGLGIAMFIDFDVLTAAVTVPTQDHVYTSLLQYGFTQVEPQPIPLSAPYAVPVDLQLQNKGTATQVRLRLADTFNTKLVAGNGWTQVVDAGQTYWQYTAALAKDAVLESTIYIQLLNNNAVSVPLEIDTSSDGSSWVQYKQVAITLAPVAPVAPPAQPPVKAIEHCGCEEDTHDDGKGGQTGQGHDHHGNGNGNGHCKPDHDHNGDDHHDGHHDKHDGHGKH